MKKSHRCRVSRKSSVHLCGNDRIASVIHPVAHYDFSGAPSPLYDKVTVEEQGAFA